MKNSSSQDEKLAKMSFARVYPFYLAKIEKKGRSRQELHELITWLTGYNEEQIQAFINRDASFEEFFDDARINKNAGLITGLICGIRVELIENPLSQKIRYLDKLVDELAKGRAMEKIKRQGFDT